MKVYFLPYLASMWRSMIPLYKEHKAAGDDVFVMPIPYYGRDMTGDLKDLYYDGYSFPVPVVDYRQVDLRRENPDKLYFHNPYDNANRVTSVAPEYYSWELRKATKELIFVPYYTKAAGDLASVVHSSGVHNADTVIVWTAAQKAAYETEAKHVAQKDFPERLFDIPSIDNSWIKKITGKNVVLFNNSLGALIDHPGRAIGQVNEIVRSFERRRGDCLWWRPHPLYAITLKALYPPGLMEYYCNTLRWFDEWDGGIYDDRWDVDSAAMIAHEYLGNPSSVVELFKDQGKKVTIV